MPQSVCLITAVAPKRSVARHGDVEAQRTGGSVERQIAFDPEAVAVGAHRCRLEADLLTPQHLVVDRLLDLRLLIITQRLHTAAALLNAQRPAVDVDLDHHIRRVFSHHQHGFPGGHVEHRSWPAMAAAPVLRVRTDSVPSSGPSAYLPAGIATSPS